MLQKIWKRTCVLFLIATMLFSTLAMGVVAAPADGAVTITAPDNVDLSMSVWIENGNAYYDVTYQGYTMVEKSRLGISTSIGAVTENITMGEETRSSKSEQWEMVVGEKDVVLDHYNEAVIPLTSGDVTVSLVARVYPSGVAFQYRLPESEQSYQIAKDGEVTEFAFPQGSRASVHISGNQTTPTQVSVDAFQNTMYRIPMTVEYANGSVLTVCTANLNGYSATYLTKSAQSARAVRTMNDSANVIDGGIKSTPWRALVVGEDAAELAAHNDLVLNLNEPADESTYAFSKWVEAGACLMTGGSMTTEGIKDLVDQAAEVGIKYVLMDYCWYGPELDDNCDPRLDPSKLDPNNKQDQILSKYIPEEGVFNTGDDSFPPYGLLDGSSVPGWPTGGSVKVNVDIPEICQYANEHGVGIMLYVNGRMLPDSAKNEDGSLRNRFTTDELFSYFEKWGVKGVKPGFVNCRDQQSEAYMEEVVRLAAEHNLVLTVHDEWVTHGLERTYPNLLSSEAILGDEGIGATEPQAAEDIATAFTRTIQGPADHTFCYPGKATKAYALASPIVFRSGIQCLYWYTSPEDIAQGDQGKLGIWKDFPANWNESICLEGKLYEYATYARRNGTSWYIGSLSAVDRLLEIPLTFLDDGVTYVAEITADGADANPNLGRQNGASCDKSAQTLEYGRYLVDNTTVLKRYLGNAYGYAAKLTVATQEDMSLPRYDAASHLKQVLEIAAQYQNDGYTDSSWKKLEDAVAAAEQLIEDGTTGSELDEAAEAILNAIDGLLSTSTLEDAVYRASCLTSYLYTKDSWETLLTARTEAQAVLDGQDLTQEAIDGALASLQSALDGMDPIQGLEAASEVSLTDLTYDPASRSDWSLKYNQDMENGDLGLIVNGEERTFAKGIFAHADAEIIYHLEGSAAQMFEAYVGVDSSKPEQGDIIFRLYGDDHLLYESEPSGNGSQEAQFLSVPIAGVKVLRLVVDKNVSDNGDWGVWGDAKLVTYLEPGEYMDAILVDGVALPEFRQDRQTYYYPAPQGGTVPVVTVHCVNGATASVAQATEVPGIAEIIVTTSDEKQVTYQVVFCGMKQAAYLSDLPDSAILSNTLLDGRVYRDRSYEDNVVELTGADGQSAMHFDKGLGLHANDATDSTVVYDIEGLGYERFEAYVGIRYGAHQGELDKGYTTPRSSVTFRIYVDNETEPRYESGTMRSRTPAEFVSIDIAGASKLRITVDANGDQSADHANLGDAKFLTYVKEAPHEHTYDQEVAEPEYLKTAATCTAAAVYYKSCACGEASTTETFTFGNALGHACATSWSSDAIHHWHDCTRCGAKVDEAAHSWNVEAATEETDKHCTVCGYVAEAQLSHTHKGTLVPGTPANCAAPGTKAYYRCTCGLYFEDAACTKQITNLDEWKVIPPLPHTYSDEWSHNETSHYHICTVCGAKDEEISHTGGEATCVSKAVCEVCGAEYGETNPANHKHTKLVGYRPATAAQAGYTGDLVCQDCSTVITAGKEIPKLSGGSIHPVTPVKPVEPSEPEKVHYDDVSVGDWYYEAVSYVTEESLMTGVGNGRFNPDGAVTRAMVWTVLARMAGEDTEGGITWYSKAQAWAMETGVSDGTNPMASITREQLAAMLYRCEGSPAVSGNLNAYPDAGEFSDWAVDAMVWATEESMINGIGGYLKPQSGATRAQLATMLMRFDG